MKWLKNWERRVTEEKKKLNCRCDDTNFIPAHNGAVQVRNSYLPQKYIVLISLR
jgi:hypothetical protein